MCLCGWSFHFYALRLAVGPRSSSVPVGPIGKLVQHLGISINADRVGAPSPKRKLHTAGCSEANPPTHRLLFAVALDAAAVATSAPHASGVPVLRSVARVPDIQPRSFSSPSFSPT